MTATNTGLFRLFALPDYCQGAVNARQAMGLPGGRAAAILAGLRAGKTLPEIREFNEWIGLGQPRRAEREAA